MRQHKFRARWADTGKLINGFMSNYSIDSLNNESFICEEYTGHQDRNGVDIYEGDIVGFRNRHTVYGFVDYCPLSGFGITWDVKTARVRKEDRLDRIPWNISTVWEVIGNIHDNPELLNCYSHMGFQNKEMV